MNKEHILSEIKRTAQENGGEPLGRGRFKDETGIRESDWSGRYWVKWSDAQKEAGFEPNQFSQPAFEQAWLIQKIIDYIRDLGHVPTQPEFKMKKINDPTFPSDTSISNHFGTKKRMVEKVKRTPD